MVGDPQNDATAGLGEFLSWFELHGGSMTDVFLEDLGGEMSLSLVTGQALSRGQLVMSIPISICMTVESAARSGLKRVLQAHPALMDTPDEVLALHLMAEKKKGEGSFWKEYLRTLPDDVDTPLRWLVEGAQDEFRLLDGTMVGILSKMMHAQVVKDWEEVHLPLVEAHPEVLGGVTFQDYLWAMSSIWSRSFDYLEPLADGSSCSRRAMVPVINAANHDPSAAESLSEMIEFQAEVEGVPNATGDRGNARGRLRVVAGRDYRAREQFFILYGRYSNAKLLYSYGFALANNPYGGLDYWTRVPPTDTGFQWKQALLDDNPLTAAQTYDFSGSVRTGGWISPALLATVRVAQLTTDERPMAGKAFEAKMVSPRNEAASLKALLAGLRRKRATMGNSVDQSAVGTGDEAKLIISLQGELEQYQHHRHREVEGEKGEGGDTKAGSGESGGGGSAVGGIAAGDPASPTTAAVTAATSEKSLRRRVAALRVRSEEKAVVTDAIAALEVSLRELQLAASSGVGAVAAFETLDSRC